MTILSTISDELILAGIERAEEHSWRSEQSGVLMSDVRRHVGLPKTSPGVKGRLIELVDQGALTRQRRNGVEIWVLTSKGRRRLNRERRSGMDLVLPESPQHEAWCKARALAEQEIDGYYKTLRDCLMEALDLLDTSPDSDAWFAIAPRLKRAAWRVGSATHCLREWAEPDDEKADIDEGLTRAEKKLSSQDQYRRKSLRSGRRNPLNWKYDEPPLFIR